MNMIRAELIVKRFGLYAIDADCSLHWITSNGSFTLASQEEAKSYLIQNNHIDRLNASEINPIFAYKYVDALDESAGVYVEMNSMFFPDVFSCLNFFCIWQECADARKLLTETQVGTRLFTALVRYLRGLEYDSRVLALQATMKYAEIQTKIIRPTPKRSGIEPMVQNK